ncbi:protein sprouty homolog 2 [Salarias fasciatus]|uniref:protein sprouty homolog 2 n=1 Tax=Salarias fasciatus TaxID=181472 RepID=UPI001176F9C1|nr:protein sprouty homolog 2-like [Salarias fasciatus]
MDSRSQSDSDGGGGHRGHSPPPPTPHDEGRLQPRGSAGPTDPGPHNRQLGVSLVLSLDQIRITGSSNEYTEGPTAAPRSPATLQRQQKSQSVPSLGSTAGGQQQTQEERPINLHSLSSPTRQGSVAEGSGSSVRGSLGSGASAQRLLAGEQTIRTQPKRCEHGSEELKPLSDGSRPTAAAATPGGGALGGRRIHSDRCEDCGRCRCPECRRPRSLPACWTCGRRCMCSAQSAVEYGTCVCCVKGLFYHCSSDDEDTCADKPFSCTQSHCCVRWTAVTLLSLVFPCVLCYLPAKGCVAACQSCYDRAARPGCRCRDSAPARRRRQDAGKPT